MKILNHIKRENLTYYHFENVRKDDDFWADYLQLSKDITEKGLFEIDLLGLTRERMSSDDPDALVQLTKPFLEKWGVTEDIFKYVRGLYRKILSAHPSGVEHDLIEARTPGYIAIEFQEDITQDEYKKMWHLIKSEKERRGIKGSRPNSALKLNSDVAYQAWKIKRDDPKKTWPEIAEVINEQFTEKTYGYDELRQIYGKAYGVTKDR